MTLARYFLKLCSEKDVTNLREISRRAKVDPTTPWRIKEGRSVRAPTLGKVLRALGYTPADAEYKQAFAYWGAEMLGGAGQQAVNAGLGKAGKTLDAATTRMLEHFTAALQDIPKRDWPTLQRALVRPAALVLWLKSTQELQK